MTGNAMRAMAMLGLAAVCLPPVCLAPVCSSPVCCRSRSSAARPSRARCSAMLLRRAARRPYDEAADARAELDRALAGPRRRPARAVGACWSISAAIGAGLSGAGQVLALEPVRRFVDDRYVVVAVDVGRFSKTSYPATLRIELKGVPTVLVLDGDGRLLNGGTRWTW